jgi:hypothetical protein
VAAQAVGTLGWLVAIDRTHNAELLNAYFKTNDGFFSVSLNPASLVREVFQHLTRITTMFPGGPGSLGVVFLAAATAGLIVAALRPGNRGVAAQFMLLMVGIAFLGAFAHRIPFGPNPSAVRAALWMAPIVAFGLAVVLQRIRGFATERGRASTKVFDAIAVALAVLLLLLAIGTHRPYPSGVHDVTEQVMAKMGPSDAVLVTRYAMFSFALDATTPVRVKPAANKVQGMIPHFADKRIVAVDFLDKAQLRQVDQALGTARRVFVVNSGFDPPSYAKYLGLLNAELHRKGFTPQGTNHVKVATLVTWVRA